MAIKKCNEMVFLNFNKFVRNLYSTNANVVEHYSPLSLLSCSTIWLYSLLVTISLCVLADFFQIISFVCALFLIDFYVRLRQSFIFPSLKDENAKVIKYKRAIKSNNALIKNRKKRVIVHL